MSKKKRILPQKKISAPTYLGSLFFVLASLGVTVLSLIATGKSADIRQQAQIDPYLTTYPTAIPTQIVLPTQIPQSPTPYIAPTIRILPTNLPPKTPTPTIKIVILPTTTKTLAKANPTSTQFPTNKPVKTSDTNTESQIAKEIVQATATKAMTLVKNTPIPTKEPVKTSDANTGNQTVKSNTASTANIGEEARRAEERTKEFLELTAATKTDEKKNTQSTAGSQIAQNIMKITNTGSTSNSTNIQTTSISSQQVFRPAVYISEEEAIEKIIQVSALNAALVNQAKKKDSIQIVVEDQGKLISHTITVPKSKDGTIDQTSLQNTVAKTVSQSNSGQVISSKSVTTVIKESTEPKPGPIMSAFNTLTTYLGGKPAQEVATGAQLLKDADVVVKTNTKGNLPITGQQINVHFDQKDIVIDQISHENLNVALGQQIAPVTAQLQTALNAESVTQSTQGSIKPVNITQNNSNVTNLAAAQMNLNQSHVAQVATIQTLASQLGTSGANVEYVSNNGLQKAYVSSSSKDPAASLKTSTDELADANQAKKTVGEQLEKFSQSSGLSQALGKIAFPGIEKLAKEPKLHVQVIHVNGDLNAQPNLNIKANIQSSERSAVTLNQPQAIIIVDDFGNQRVQVYGNESAEKLQSQIEANPPGLLELINNNLQTALNK